MENIENVDEALNTLGIKNTDVENSQNSEVSQSELDYILSKYSDKTIEGEDLIDEKTNEFSQETEKKKRGRKKGSKNKNSENTEDSNVIDSSLLTGALLILIIDLLFPMVIVTVNNFVNKKTKIDLEDLQLTDKQKKDLAPVADAVAKKININNPVLLLVICLGGMYGMKYTTALALKKEDEKIPNKK